MNKIEALNEKALEAAVLAHDKEEAAMRGEPDPWTDEQPEDEFADRKAAMAEAIRAYLTASDAEREPVCWIPTETAKWLEEYDGPACATQTAVHNRPIKSDGGIPLYAAPLPLTDLEAENAKLRERLAEALKALEVTRAIVSEAAMTGFNCHEGNWAERLYANNGNISAVLDARRVREGGKVDG